MLLRIAPHVSLSKIRPDIAVAVVATHAAYARVGADLVIAAAGDTWVEFVLPPGSATAETVISDLMSTLWTAYLVTAEADRLRVSSYPEPET